MNYSVDRTGVVFLCAEVQSLLQELVWHGVLHNIPGHKLRKTAEKVNDRLRNIKAGTIDLDTGFVAEVVDRLKVEVTSSDGGTYEITNDQLKALIDIGIAYRDTEINKWLLDADMNDPTSHAAVTEIIGDD